MSASLTTAQKAPLVVTDANGNNIDANHRLLHIDGTAVTTDGSENWIYGNEPGTATLTVSANGQVGTLDVTVTAAPLTVTLGPAEAK